MKRYLAHIQSQPPHYRRQHAVKIAGMVTGVIFVGWLGTLGARLAAPPKVTEGTVSQETQLANVINGIGVQEQRETLEVSTSTTYIGQ